MCLYTGVMQDKLNLTDEGTFVWGTNHINAEIHNLKTTNKWIQLQWNHKGKIA